MSEISDVYDAIIAKMASIFPSKTRIPNPYIVESNPDRCLKDSWGVAVSSGSRQELTFCHLQLERIFNIILTRETFILDSKPDGFDSSVKNLLEDARTIQLEFYKIDELGIEDKIDQLDVLTSSDIESVFVGKKKFLKIEVTISIKTSDLIK